MNLEQDLFYANHLIRRSYAKKTGFDFIYPFTTENINGYLSLCDLKDKRVLTVGSSSDQILNSFLRGAKEVDCFDINPFVKYYFDLKKAAIKALTLEEFENFFTYFEYSKILSGNKNAFNIESFCKIINYLEGDSLIFWSSLFKKYKGLNIRKNLFSSDENDLSVIKQLNCYMNETNYNNLKNKIDLLNPTFYNIDVQNISKYLNKKYDYILLSNLSSYIYYSHNNSLEKFRDNILEFKPFMYDDSLVFFAYLYEVDRDTKIKGYWDKICQIPQVQEAFKNEQIFMDSFIGVKGIIYNDPKFKDSVLVYKK